MVSIDALLEFLDGVFHLGGCLDVREGLEVDEGPYFVLDEFGL